MKALARHPYWNRQFIGMGPYRLADWGGGKQIVLEANPYYALGTPKIDRVILRIVEDSNVGLSSVLAGEADLALRQVISLDGATVLKEQWETLDRGKVIITPVTFRWLNLSGTNPLFKDVRVRRALLHAIDRDGLVKTTFKGYVPVNHFPLSPARKSYKRAETAATKYEYSPGKAKQLLAEAGWKPGADGVLANAKGERMEFEFRAEAGNRTDEQTQAIIVDAWKQLGVQCQIKNLPQRLANSEEYRNRWPGAMIGGMSSSVEEWAERFHTTYTPTEENRYATQAVSLWRNAQADAIMDELNTIISEDRAIELQVEFAKLYSRDLPYLPLHYTAEILAIKKGLSGIIPRIETGGANANTWNIHLWDKT
jgi:peptide/nickel transport system substrate-binding protein